MPATLEPPTRTIPNYRQQLRRALPDSVFKPDLHSLIWYPIHAAIIGTALWALTAHFSWFLAPIAALVIGHSFACMGFLGHDVCHGGGIKKLWIRDLLAGIAFSPFAIGPYLWRRWHNGEHHGNTQIEGLDPDHLFTIEAYKHNPILKFLYRLTPLARNLIIFGSFTYRMSQQMLRMYFTYMFSKKSTFANRVTLFLELVIPAALWVGGTLALGTQVFWWGYVIPLLIGNTIVIGYIATNHFLNPLADESDVLATSLSVTLPKALAWLDPWHQSFGAHVGHHLFPQISPKNCRVVEDKAAELWPERYHVMPLFTALKMLWNTPWIYEDHETLIDPHRDIHAKTLGHGMVVDPPKKP